MAIEYLVNSYIEDLATAQKFMLNNDLWNSLSDASKEAQIIAASYRIDQLEFFGDKVSESQDMEFPRDFHKGDSVEPPFDLNSQKKRLRKATMLIIDNDLGRLPLNTVSQTLQGETIIQRNQFISREAVSLLQPFIRNINL